MSKRIIGAVSIVVVVAVGSTTYLNSQPTPPETSSITTAQIGCPDGMIEDMSVVECVVDGRVSLDAPDRNLAVQRRELANTLLTENSDTETAAKLYRIAAIDGDISAQFALANMLAQGIGVERNTTESLKWLREAALNGHAMAQVMWGAALINGEGIEADVTEGSRWVIRGMAKWSEEDRDIDPVYVGI
jgi:hypothetical protein